MRNETCDPKYHVPDDSLPDAVQELCMESNRPAIRPECLFFRGNQSVYNVPDMAVRGRHESWGPFALEHRLYFLMQSDGSLAVYAYLFDGSSAGGRSYGCLYVGCVPSKYLTVGN